MPATAALQRKNIMQRNDNGPKKTLWTRLMNQETWRHLSLIDEVNWWINRKRYDYINFQELQLMLPTSLNRLENMENICEVLNSTRFRGWSGGCCTSSACARTRLSAEDIAAAGLTKPAPSSWGDGPPYWIKTCVRCNRWCLDVTLGIEPASRRAKHHQKGGDAPPTGTLWDKDKDKTTSTQRQRWNNSTAAPLMPFWERWRLDSLNGMGNRLPTGLDPGWQFPGRHKG